MEEKTKTAKILKLLCFVLALALVLVGAIRAFRGDSLALAEDGLMGLGIGVLGYSISLVLVQEKEAGEEKMGDEGL